MEKDKRDLTGMDEAHSVERKELLRLARLTLSHYLRTGQVVPYSTSSLWLRSPAAVFVTLRQRPAARVMGEPPELGALRGCIGQIEIEEPLYLAVQYTTIKAATTDPRFHPVTQEELDGITIEISILSPMRPVDSPDEILLGQDGLLLEGNHRRGLLLPEVPVNYGWGKEEFVSALHDKAGLPDHSWPGRARLFAFTTETFEDPPQ